MMRPSKRPRNSAPRSFMKPALMTRSGWYAATCVVKPRSQSVLVA